MSLHNAAQHLASQGRHGDTLLVHMNPKEVAGLQALAEHKGTSLTTNPHTGLPEAFSLGDLNPVRILHGKGEIGESGFGSMLIGAALMAAGVPAMAFGPGALSGAAGAGVLTGGLAALTGGGLKGGLSAGLGAYGGASMYGAMNPAAPAAAPNAPGATPTPPAAPAAAPVAPPAGAPPSAPPSGYFDNTMTAAENAVTPAQAEALKATQPVVATTTPAPTGESSTLAKAGSFAKEYAWPLTAAGALALTQEKPKGVDPEEKIPPGKIRHYIYDPKTQGLRALRPYDAPGYADGGPVEQMSNANAIGMNTGYPQADVTGHAYSTPWQTPVSQNVVQGTPDTGVNRMTGQMLAGGGLSSLGGYSDGGRMLKGPGDGMSDNIPAVIGGKQPARLADGEFVVPADVVSHLGNGSTDAGAKQLYKMMDRIRQQRTGKKRQAPEVNPKKSMPA